MRILYEDRVTSITTQEGNLTGFPIANVQGDIPRQAFISSGTTEVITVSCKGTVDDPVQAFFISNLLADSATWVLNSTDSNYANPSQIETGTLRTTYGLDSTLGGNSATGSTFFSDQAAYLPAQFITFSNEQTGYCQLVITLVTSVNVGGKNLAGNAAARWNQDSTVYGRFEDSAGSAINVINHGRIFVGSHVGTAAVAQTYDSNTTLSSSSGGAIVIISPLSVTNNAVVTIDNGTNDSVVEITSVTSSGQILQITGDGTAADSVQLDSAIADTNDLQAIFNPLRLGILRVGKVLTLPDARPGATKSLNDYSVRRPQPTGGYTYQQRPVGHSVGLSLVLTNTQAEDLEAVSRSYRSKPMPILWVEDMPATFLETSNATGFYYLNPPSFGHISRDYQSCALQLTEVI
jgi:hypothetical protein